MSKQNRVLEFFITTLNGMAYGLFATLIIGTIIATIGTLLGSGDPGVVRSAVAAALGNGRSGLSYVLQILTGAGIGAGIALALKMDSLRTIVMASVGELAAFFSLSTKFVTAGIVSDALKIGDPLTIYLVCISVALLIQLVLRKKTPVDILLIPLFGVLCGTVLAMVLRYPSIFVTYGIQWIVNAGTNLAPLLMGAVVAAVMGMALTAPISSAAIAAMIFILPEGMTVAAALADPQFSGLVIASGAAVVGCSTQMVGLAVQARKDVSVGEMISIGIGTSMLEFKNILRKPVIWLPSILVSAVLGPVATCLVHVICMGSSAGMGTAGLVGQIGTFASMGNTTSAWVSIIGLQIIAPALLVWAVDLLFRRFRLIAEGDFKI
ncbi:MAG: PTS sugar transporter subunit IIC [Bacteroidales bacterium]|nr:PTS sugar transporter subunit IIC [Bacteroidales bacterium]